MGNGLERVLSAAIHELYEHDEGRPLIGSRGKRIRAPIRSRETRYSERGRLAAFLCLIGVLAQFFLPIAHTAWHAAEDISIPLITDVLCSCSGDPHNAAVPRLISTPERASHRSQHDPSTCSICQTLQHSSNFTFEHYSPVSSALTIGGLLFSDYSGTCASGCNVSGGGPRAPPHLV